jgi:L-ascorbate metabolism protein UlaG (beta-lactamase superfamily)
MQGAVAMRCYGAMRRCIAIRRLGTTPSGDALVSVVQFGRMKRIVKVAVMAAGGAAIGAAIERTMLAAPHYQGPLREHFDGRRFHNQDPGRQGEGSFLQWQLTRDPGYWPEWIDAPPGPPPPARVGDGAMRITFINHATLLLQLDGLNILTDPMWSERAAPFGLIGPRRHRPPGIRFEELPPIDAVLVSHNHYDHLDVATLRRLRARPAGSRRTGRQAAGAPGAMPDASGAMAGTSGAVAGTSDTMARPMGFPIITPLGNGLLMKRHGVDHITELDWWGSTPLANGVQITLVPAQHFCSRALSDHNANLWGGFVISGPSGNAYFAGDTGWGRHFEQIKSRFAPIRLALLPIGAYLPRWFMKPMHIDPAEAVEAHRVLGAGTSVGMHFGTFHLGDDGMYQPVRDLQRAIEANGNPSFLLLNEGEGREVP